MKKLILAALSAALVLGLAACGGAGSAKEPKNMAEVIAISSDNKTSGFNSEEFVVVYEADGKFYLVKALMTDELYDQISQTDIFDESNTEVQAVLEQIPVESFEDITSTLPSQEELDKLIGSTGQELLDAGYIPSGYLLSEEGTTFWAGKDAFAYELVFNEDVGEQEDPDLEELMAPLTLKSIKYSSIALPKLEGE